MNQMIKQAEEVIAKTLVGFKKPAIMWSGGKDSMALLSLIRNMYGKVPYPVIFHREPFMPEKFEFHHKVERQWGFVSIDYAPMTTSLQKNNGVLEIARRYQVGPKMSFLVPVSHYEDGMIEGEYLCGLNDLMRRPCGTFVYPWDVTFIGHKSCDTDAFCGGLIPLKVDIKLNVGAPSCSFPIREWTHDDVWDYIEANDVPYDSRRYDIKTRKERKNKRFNSDWYQCCVRCMDRDGPDQVDCPALGMKVTNISEQIPYSDPERMKHFETTPKELQADGSLKE